MGDEVEYVGTTDSGYQEWYDPSTGAYSYTNWNTGSEPASGGNQITANDSVWCRWVRGHEHSLVQYPGGLQAEACHRHPGSQ